MESLAYLKQEFPFHMDEACSRPFRYKGYGKEKKKEKWHDQEIREHLFIKTTSTRSTRC